MNISIGLLPPGRGHALWSMTFPRYRPLLAVTDPAIVALVASAPERPLALALARQEGAELLSLYVHPSQRRCGLGRRLLAALETELAGRGCRAVSTVWMSGTPGAEAFAALLEDRGWSPPQPRMVVYHAELERLGAAAWMHAFAGLPAGYAILPWAELTAAQLATLRQVIRFEGWVPAELDPFAFAGRGIDGAAPEPALSLACTLWDEVVGWNLAHRIDAETVRISCTFIRPDMQQQLLMLTLWREAYMRQVATTYRRISWAVAAERAAMVGFNDKYMGPYLRRRSETWASRKLIAA